MQITIVFYAVTFIDVMLAIVTIPAIWTVTAVIMDMLMARASIQAWHTATFIYIHVAIPTKFDRTEGSVQFYECV
jgi:hypothetical protein